MNVAEFRTGPVLRQAVAALRPNLGRWLVLAALVQTPIIFYVLSGLGQQMPQGPLAAAIATTVHVAFYVIAQAAVAAAMLAHLRGQQVSLGELLGTAWRQAPMLRFAIGFGLLEGLLTFVPFELGLWSNFWLSSGYNFACHALLYLFLAVTLPVLVNERTGALEALKRSAFLTRDHRGRLLGLFTLLYLFRSALLFPLLLWATTSGSSESFIERIEMWSLANALIGPVFWGVIDTSAYRALRLAREGVEILSTPSVPDARIHTAE